MWGNGVCKYGSMKLPWHGNAFHIIGPLWREFVIDRTIPFNLLRPRQNGRPFPDDILKWIFVNKNAWISISISLKFVPRGPINNIPTLIQIMAWRRPGDKTLFEPMLVSLLTHICVTRSQWFKASVMQTFDSFVVCLTEQVLEQPFESLHVASL